MCIRDRVYYDYHDYLRVESLLVDGTNRQSILQLSDRLPYYSGLSLYKSMIFLSETWNSEIHKISTNGENFTTIINGSVHCWKAYHRLKIVSEEQQPPGKMRVDSHITGAVELLPLIIETTMIGYIATNNIIILYVCNVQCKCI